MQRGRRLWSLGVMLGLLATEPAWAGNALERLGRRGPPTLAVGALFTVASPPALLVGAARGRSLSIHACRLGHGLKMLVAGALLLPAGLLVAPLHPAGLPAAWMDGVVDAFQEDTCSRPWGSLYP